MVIDKYTGSEISINFTYSFTFSNKKYKILFGQRLRFHEGKNMYYIFKDKKVSNSFVQKNLQPYILFTYLLHNMSDFEIEEMVMELDRIELNFIEKIKSFFLNIFE